MTSILDFTKAAAEGNMETLKAGVSSIKNIDATDQDNLTALCRAIMNNQFDAVQLLLDSKASTKAKMEDGRSIIQWARDQKEGDIAMLIMLYNYMDRLCFTSESWAKNKNDYTFCDTCSVKVGQYDSLVLTIDEVFESETYTKCLYDQCLAMKDPKFKNMSKEELLDYIKKQIKDYNHSDNYVVCNECISRFFQKIVYGNFHEYLVNTVNEIIDQANKNS